MDGLLNIYIVTAAGETLTSLKSFNIVSRAVLNEWGSSNQQPSYSTIGKWCHSCENLQWICRTSFGSRCLRNWSLDFLLSHWILSHLTFITSSLTAISLTNYRFMDCQSSATCLLPLPAFLCHCLNIPPLLSPSSSLPQDHKTGHGMWYSECLLWVGILLCWTARLKSLNSYQGLSTAAVEFSDIFSQGFSSSSSSSPHKLRNKLF